jgi:hypothetical protein
MLEQQGAQHLAIPDLGPSPMSSGFGPLSGTRLPTVAATWLIRESRLEHRAEELLRWRPSNCSPGQYDTARATPMMGFPGMRSTKQMPGVGANSECGGGDVVMRK